jgi:hypothetical protein
MISQGKNKDELILEFMVALAPKIFDSDAFDEEITAEMIVEAADLLATEFLENFSKFGEVK